jgi:hypothetical protein
VQGVILDEFRQYVAVRFGFRAWTQVLTAAGRPAAHRYKLDEVYPDEELGLLAARTAQVTSQPLLEVLEGFGEALVPEMLRIYSYLVDPRWTYAEFLFHMEPVLHQALQLHTPGAEPTKLHTRQLGPQAVEVVYESPLRACAAVRGVIRGAAAEYGVAVDIAEDQCVLRGDPRCVFTIEIGAAHGGHSARP